MQGLITDESRNAIPFANVVLIRNGVPVNVAISPRVISLRLTKKEGIIEYIIEVKNTKSVGVNLTTEEQIPVSTIKKKHRNS